MAKVGLGKPSTLGSDRLVLRHDDYGALAGALSEALAERRFAPADAALVDLHRHLAPSASVLDENYMNDVTRSFYSLTNEILAGYRRLVRMLAVEVLGFDVLFQAAPVVRFHPPARFPTSLQTAIGRGSQFHSDILGGHPIAMINGWLALTSAVDDGALHLARIDESVAILKHFAEGRTDGQLAGSLGAFFAAQREDHPLAERVAAVCLPLAMQPGDLVLFDARCLHGGAENAGPGTRVSLDFRLVPLAGSGDGFEVALAEAHPRWRRGEILDSRSAFELDESS